MKKLLCIFLTLAVLFSFVSPVFAEESIPVSTGDELDLELEYPTPPASGECYSPNGHSFGISISAGTPSVLECGYELQQCYYCHAVVRTQIPSYQETFSAFEDITEDSWYYRSVKGTVSRGLFNGIDTTTFAPNREMTRAMMVMVLWRYEGSPYGSPFGFEDIDFGDWYLDAVRWAAKEGIIKGVGNDRFNPNGSISREQLATILYRYANLKGLNTETTGDFGSYPDGGQVSSWASEAMSWAIGTGMINGVGKNGRSYLMPKSNATRAQVATILDRFFDNVVEAPQYPDLETALDSGTFSVDFGATEITWAFYESGLLQFGGPTGYFIDHTAPRPWEAYKDRVTTIEFLYGVPTVWGVFEGYPALETVIMADSVKFINEEAFKNCSKLQNVTFSSELMTISTSAFENCTALREVRIPLKAPVSIGAYAFSNNVSLETVDFGKNTRNIGEYAFHGCTSLVDLELPNSLLDSRGFFDGVYHFAIGKGAFSDCTALETCLLPMGMQYMAPDTFAGCTSLCSIGMPMALERMFSGTFRGCTSLWSVTFFYHVEQISTGSFMGCTALEEITFLNDNMIIDVEDFDPSTTEDSLPFGDRDRVVIYAYDSEVVDLARYYGYQAELLESEY